MTDVEVSCLPKDLPEFLAVDVTEMTLDQIVHLSDITLPQGVKLVALEHGSDHAIFAIHAPRRSESVTEAGESAEATGAEEASD